MPRAASTESERIQQLRGIIAEILEIEPGELTATSDFVKDHYADSLMAIDMVVRIQAEIGVQIPNEAIPEMVNLSAVLGVVARYAGDSPDTGQRSSAPT